MSDYKFVNPTAMQPVTVAATVKNHPLGLRAEAIDQTLGLGVFQYVQGSTNAAGNLCYIAGNTAKALGSNTNFGSAGPVGIAAAALTGTGHYGWVQIAGICDFAIAHGAMTVGGMAIVGSVVGQMSYLSANATTGVNRIAPPIPVLSSASASTAALVCHLNYPTVVGV